MKRGREGKGRGRKEKKKREEIDGRLEGPEITSEGRCGSWVVVAHGRRWKKWKEWKA
jgi:hypothetical protein